MAYDLSQALAELATLTANGPATTSALMNLVSQVSVEASGSVTVLYSGNMPDGTTRTSSIIQNMLAGGQDIRVLDKSAAGLLLKSDEFLIAVENNRGQTPIFRIIGV